MNLSQALDLKPGDVVAFVGAGGKTSAMFRLADELVAQGWRVISTTTTRMAQDEIRRAPQQIGLGHQAHLPDSLPEQIEQYRHIFVFGKLDADNKMRGVRPTWLDEYMAHAPYQDVLLVEADGSRRLPMKAPFSHEPVIPESATVVMPVVGLSALRQPLDDDHVYGAEVVHNTTGYPLSNPVTTRLVAAVLISPQLGLKNIPPKARIVPLLNQVTTDTLPQAREVAAFALTDLNVERVLIGAVQEAEPVREVRRRVGAVILAAGQSRRMGRPKLLLPWDGSTIIRRVCELVTDCGLYETVVVAGEQVEAIRRQVAGLPLRVIYNPRFAEGEILSSLQVGLEAIWQTSDACLVVLGDQPAIEKDVVLTLLAAYSQEQGRIIAPTYDNRRGHPLLFDRALWQAILDLPPGKAPRDLLSTHTDEIVPVAVNTDSVLRDIDTPDDYEKARQSAGQGKPLPPGQRL